MKNFIIRGVLIGGSLGVLSALFGFSENLPKSFIIGAIGGILAGITLTIRHRKKNSLSDKNL